MRALLAVALALAIALPPTAQARDPDPYPDVLTALLPAFIAESEGRGEASEGAAWYPQAEAFLQKAKDAQAQGRFRLVLFHLETYEEIVVANRLNDSIAGLGSEGERKSRVLQATQAHHEDAEARWATYRQKLDRFDGKIQSLRTIESALYASDVALTAIVTTDVYDELVRDFPRQPTTEIEYVQALVRASHNGALVLGWADRMLDAVVADASEGLPPLANQTNMTLLMLEAVRVQFTGAGIAPGVQQVEKYLQPARENGEGLLAVAGIFADKRMDRLHQMQTQFGDARARRNVVEDADRFMDKALNNTTVENARAWGLHGVFSADAIDRALYAHELIAAQKGDLTTVLVAWSAIDAAHYAEELLQTLSLEKPQPPVPSRAPFLAPVALAFALALALTLKRRPSR